MNRKSETLKKRRVVVTGVGIVCSVGVGVEEPWKNILNGVSGIDYITLFDASEFPVKFAAEVKDFNPLDFVDKKEAKRLDRFLHFAMAASHFAVSMSGIDFEKTDRERVGVEIGSGIGGFSTIEREHEKLLKMGPRRISPFFIPSAIVNMASGIVSIKYGAKGPNVATCTACSTSTHAVGDAYRMIERGDADVMISGGSEAAITPMGIGGFASMRALSTRNDAPQKASRPFEKNRDGFVVGEGAGILILEELEHALNRGANIIAEIVGYGLTGDAFHITAPAEDGDGAYRAMKMAIESAGIKPEDIDYINAHGTSTPYNDKIETKAIKKLMGEHAKKVVISSTKSMVGHLLGGAGALEAAFTVLSIRDQIVPPTINYEEPDPECDLDYCPNSAREVKINYAMSNSFGFGGTNGVLVFKKFEE